MWCVSRWCEWSGTFQKWQEHPEAVDVGGDLGAVPFLDDSNLLSGWEGSSRCFQTRHTQPTSEQTCLESSLKGPPVPFGAQKRPFPIKLRKKSRAKTKAFKLKEFQDWGSLSRCGVTSGTIQKRPRSGRWPGLIQMKALHLESSRSWFYLFGKGEKHLSRWTSYIWKVPDVASIWKIRRVCLDERLLLEWFQPSVWMRGFI